jgi:HlyD family secretion protein
MRAVHKIGIALAAACVSGAVVWYELELARRSRPRVWTEPTDRRDIVATIAAPGTLGWARLVTVAAAADRRISAVHVRPGQLVSAGQRLIDYDPVPAEIQSEQDSTDATMSHSRTEGAVVSLGGAGSNAEFARRVAERHERLFAAGLVAADAVAVAHHDADIARLEVEARRAAVAAVEAEARATLAGRAAVVRRARAPIAGVVTQVFVQPGQWAHAGSPHVPPTRLVTIGGPAVSRVDLQLDQLDAARVRRGQLARVTVTNLSSKSLSAHVLYVQQNAGATMRVTLELDAPTPGARDGMSAVVHVTVASRTAVLGVPNHALVGSRGGVRASPVARAARGKPKQRTDVWTVRGGVMALAPLTLGLRGDAYSEVLSGLGVGQLVVTGPYALLRSMAVGDPVTPVPAPRLVR